ncbi:hypothetical protein [Nitrospirillum iridis]|uniref:Uncharacterized protein n=1 Tax=Nitrospirillum iridis TaxID=765888 RepID=A0A7X0EFZ2_9PROT|nr:hypothetical protein [Nitrospirillum iridis]MBB6254460.1 hypothetical protein [Nitrospirillum iridis]
MQTETVMIHVRFAPNGTVVEIGERPPALAPQDWFNHLSLRAGMHYQTFVGGRGLFRLPRPEVESLKADVAA